MRLFIVILLCFSLLMQSAGSLLTIVHYELNKEFIAKNLCENKAKVSMHCNGKCHLKKQLEKENSKNNSSSRNLREKTPVQFFSESKKTSYTSTSAKRSELNSAYLMFNYNTFLLSVFHPPEPDHDNASLMAYFFTIS